MNDAAAVLLQIPKTHEETVHLKILQTCLTIMQSPMHPTSEVRLMLKREMLSACDDVDTSFSHRNTSVSCWACASAC